jgi:hypothetical protein
MAVEAVDVVISALAAGAAAGAKDTASAAVKDAYAGLLSGLRRRFGQAKADEIQDLAKAHIDDGDVVRKQLMEALDSAKIAVDDDLLAAANSVLAQRDPTRARASKYTVDMRNAQAVQVGDHNTMTVHLDSCYGK